MKTLNKLLQKINEKLYSAIINKNLTALKAEINSITFQAINLYSLNRVNELRELLQHQQKWTNAIAGTFDTTEENIAYQMGLLNGTVMTIAQLEDKQSQIEKYEITTHLDTKYQDKIIEQLLDKEYIQHNQLAQNLGISSSQLSTIMNKLEGVQQNIISMSRIGKFKYYCLTDMGKRYYYGRHKGNFRDEINELLQSISEKKILKKQSTIKHFVDKYYPDDLELAQRAVKIDNLLNFLEKKHQATNAAAYLSPNIPTRVQQYNIDLTVYSIKNITHESEKNDTSFFSQEEELSNDFTAIKGIH